MMYTIEDLIELYAEQNDMDTQEATRKYKEGHIEPVELLDAYLEEEGIIGYTSSLWSIFEALKGTN